MLNFIKLTLADIEKIRPYFLFSTNRTCDNTIGGTFMWRDFYAIEYAIWNNTLVFKAKIESHNGVTAFTYPLGDDIAGCIRKIEDYCEYAQLPVVYCSITQNELPVLKTLYGNTRVSQESNRSDYLYSKPDIVSLAGRKYHGQRNHINSFNRTYNDFSFEVISKKNIDEVKGFFDSLSGLLVKESIPFAEEQAKTVEVLNNYDKYGMFGGLIRVGNAVAAFSIGEIYGDVLFVHIEKADISYRGIYPVINNEFARHFADDNVRFINREEDIGDPGLRIAKLAYHPIDMIDKYIVEVLSYYDGN